MGHNLLHVHSKDHYQAKRMDTFQFIHMSIGHLAVHIVVLSFI